MFLCYLCDKNMKCMKQKVIILSRVSTFGQDLKQQTEAVKRLCYVDGFSDDEIIIIEDKESAVLLSEEERNGLNEMKSIILNKDNHIVCVYAYEISRISRRSEINYSIRNFLRDNKVQLKIVTPAITVFDDDWNVGAEANLMYSLFAALAENEGYIRKARFARGKERLKKMGKFLGGKVSFGYDVDSEGKFVINEEQADAIKRVFRLYCHENYSLREIARMLWQEGILTQKTPRGRYEFLNKLMKNKKYLGDNRYPKIVSEEDFNIAKELFEMRTVKPRLCYVGNVYYGHKLLLVEGTKRHFVVCKNRNSYYDEQTRCSVNMNIMDSLLLYCSDYAYKQHCSGDYEKILFKYQEDLKAVNRRLVNYDNEESKVRNALDRLEERIIYGTISDKKSDEIRKRLLDDLNKLMSSRRDDQNYRISLENNIVAIQEDDDEALDVYQMNDNERKDFINKEIKFVRIKKLEAGRYLANICYQNPLIDGQIYEIISRKHIIKLYGKVVDIEILERFGRK